MSIFDRHKNTGDYVTRGEAVEYLQGLPTKDDAATVMRALEELDGRVSELENLARTLRGGGLPRRQEAVRTASVGLTKAEAEAALRSLREDGAREFKALGDKVDQAVAQLRNVSTPQGEYSHSTTEATTVDYGAIAFGLSQVKRDVVNVLGEHARASDLTEHYRQTVQYFADVFAKSDPTFDADAFKAQAGA